MKTITVDLAARAYPIFIGNGALAQAGRFAAPVNAIITTPAVGKLYGEQLLTPLQQDGKTAFMLTVPDGETSKSLDCLQRLLDDMFAKKMGRDSAVFSLGGGVIGDLGGFAAAIYMRGIAVVQVPTTLLAQVDAAIGGKTGINHPSGKNLIGAFHQPRAVLADLSTLESLPTREYCAGLAEVVKYGLLADGDFFTYLEDNRDAIMKREAAALETIISRSAQIKADIVAADETEHGGRRALLNLGHTFAHAAETVCGYGQWLHGEAVAFGLVAAAALSVAAGGFTADERARIEQLLTDLQLPIRLPSGSTPTALLAAMAIDKKNVAGHKRFILMHRIGDAFITTADNEGVLSVLEAMQ